MNVTATAIREKLLAAANALEGVEFPEARAIADDLQINVHGVTTREQLAAWVKLLSYVRKHRIRTTCWIVGDIGGIEVTVYYQFGVLGEVESPPGEIGVEALLSAGGER